MNDKRWYGGPAWKAVRAQAKARDGHRCVKCGSTQNLDADHIRRPEDGGHRYDLSNTQTLCRRCHNHKTHGKNRPVDASRLPSWVRKWALQQANGERILEGIARGDYPPPSRNWFNLP
jgi:5-methylcytosine-specific restriction endonuclease McrA